MHVNVNILDTADAPTGTATKFSNAPAGTDPMTVLYPYVGTVFPLALRAPTIQWDNGGTTADAVMVSLQTPAAGPATFLWSKVLPDSNPGRYTIPQDIWSQFEGTGKGKAASYTVQRVTGGIARPPVVRNFSFAVAPVRGKIYYTQYARDGSTNMMVADPGSPTTAKSVFPSDAGSSDGRKCPVCHSVSANGSMFATSDKTFSANGGLSQINTDGTFTLLSDYTTTKDPYQIGQEDWRGFAWSLLTPDGTYALAANNIWGNSKQNVVGIDKTARVVSLPGTYVSGGNGTGLLAKYYMNTGFTGWDWRRTDGKIDFNWDVGSPGGPVPTTFSVGWTGQVQAYTTETYTFSVTTTGGVKLAVGGNVLVDQLANTANTTFTGNGGAHPRRQDGDRDAVRGHERGGARALALEQPEHGRCAAGRYHADHDSADAAVPERRLARRVGDVLRQQRLHESVHHRSHRVEHRRHLERWRTTADAERRQRQLERGLHRSDPGARQRRSEDLRQVRRRRDRDRWRRRADQSVGRLRRLLDGVRRHRRHEIRSGRPLSRVRRQRLRQPQLANVRHDDVRARDRPERALRPHLPLGRRPRTV